MRSDPTVFETGVGPGAVPMWLHVSQAACEAARENLETGSDAARDRLRSLLKQWDALEAHYRSVQRARGWGLGRPV